MAPQHIDMFRFEDRDPFVGYGRTLLRKTIDSDISVTGASLPTSSANTTALKDSAAPPVGILGGGMAGLYTALILADLKVPFQILEATNRIGGRCFTHRFDEGGEYDYFDVGAMRFPLPRHGERGPHKRLKKLFDLLEVPLLDYHNKNPQGIMYFNGLHSTIENKKFDFNLQALGVAEPYRAAGLHDLCEDFLEEPLRDLIESPGPEGWERFMAKYDKYSIRSYLQFKYKPSQDLRDRYADLPEDHLPACVINWLETFDQSSGWYECALVETVLDAIAFGTAPGAPAPQWRCIDHGSSVLPEMTLQKVRDWAKDTPNMPEQVIVQQAPVTAIRASDPEDKGSPLIVTAGGKEYTYSHVISTVPLTNFSFIDTSSLKISVMQQNAIRQLQYGPSIKVGILFKTAWWKDDHHRQQPGGQSFTDLPIRTIVYPSYGDDQSSRVLIASYCWTNDAERLGNIIDNKVDGVLLDLVLRNLATVHQMDVDELRKQYVNHFAWNWNHSAWTAGAFASFGPGQYENLYEAMNLPAADGRLQWAGELMSVRHAWIIGALDSAWAACLRYLILAQADGETFRKFYTQWGVNSEWHDGKKSFECPLTSGPSQGSLDSEPPLAIPHEHNLLARHLALYKDVE